MYSKDRISLLNTYYHNLSMAETLDAVRNAISNGHQIHHSVINAAKVVALQKDKSLRTSVNDADIINIDGQAVLWAAKLLNKPIKEKVSGIDLMDRLVALAYQEGYTIYLLGAKEAVLTKVVDIYRKKYNDQLIAGYRNGYFSKEEEIDVFRDIEEKKPNILFIAISTPKKENLLFTYKNQIKSVNLIMGVGGSFDVIAGYTKRAPVWMQNLGLEWFYRLIQEPRRMWRRYLVGNTKFIFLIFREKLVKGKTKTDE